MMSADCIGATVNRYSLDAHHVMRLRSRMATSPPEGHLVLIVDDFDDALEIYEQYLTFKGYRVMTAGTGAEAVELARARHPSLIFMDLRMAVMTGTEAMQLLRQDVAFNDVPIVAFTAHALDDEKAIALAAGFDEVIPKPCLPDDLMAAVNRLLANPRRVYPA
jgi:two-component system cell cycle response regulator DivK